MPRQEAVSVFPERQDRAKVVTKERNKWLSRKLKWEMDTVHGLLHWAMHEKRKSQE